LYRKQTEKRNEKYHMRYLTTIFSGSSCAEYQTKTFFIGKNTAISGYDPVSYFSNKPLKGKANLTYNYEGINYRFANPNNLETFKKTPEKYEPAYGGWCAYAMGAKGEKVEVDPENYRIYEGKLYLFYKNFFSNTLDDWKKEEVKLKKQADSN
jgi:YHS domain-containing protein